MQGYKRRVTIGDVSVCLLFQWTEGELWVEWKGQWLHLSTVVTISFRRVWAHLCLFVVNNSVCVSGVKVVVTGAGLWYALQYCCTSHAPWSHGCWPVQWPVLTNKKLAIIAGHVSILSELARAQECWHGWHHSHYTQGETSGAGCWQYTSKPGQDSETVQVVKIVKVGATMLIWFLASNTLLTLKLSS